MDAVGFTLAESSPGAPVLGSQKWVLWDGACGSAASSWGLMGLLVPAGQTQAKSKQSHHFCSSSPDLHLYLLGHMVMPEPALCSCAVLLLKQPLRPWASWGVQEHPADLLELSCSRQDGCWTCIREVGTVLGHAAASAPPPHCNTWVLLVPGAPQGPLQK